MLICPKHFEVIDRTHRQCDTAERLRDWGGCLMGGRGGYPFSDYELDWLEHVEGWRTRLLEHPAPLTRDERDSLAELLVIGMHDFLVGGPYPDLPEEAPSA